MRIPNLFNNYVPDPTVLQYFNAGSLQRLLHKVGLNVTFLTVLGYLPSYLTRLDRYSFVNFVRQRLIVAGQKLPT